MNVAFDPWIPVVTTSGKPDLASLCDVLTKGVQFVDLAVRPHERVSLMRLFLCVAHAALNGPKDYDEWCKVPERLPEAVQKYLMSCFTKKNRGYKCLDFQKLWKVKIYKLPQRIGHQFQNSTFPLRQEIMRRFLIIVG